MVIACLIDLVRIPVYMASYAPAMKETSGLLLVLLSVTFLGTLSGNVLLRRFPLSHFKKLVAALITLMGLYFLLF